MINVDLHAEVPKKRPEASKQEVPDDKSEREEDWEEEDQVH
jgi:hypothetical protein